MTFTSDEATTFCSSFSSCVVSDIFSYFIFHYGTASAQLVTKTFFFSYFLNKQTTLSFWNKTRHESSKFACKPPSPSFVHLLLVGNVGATGSLVAVHFSATPCTSTTPHGVLPKDKRSLSKLWMEASGSWENPSKMSSSALVSTWSRSQPMFSAKLVLWRLTGSLILRSLLTYWKAGNHASWAARDQKAVIMVFTLGSFP